MYWVHRFRANLKKQLIVMCCLLERRNCLTIDWREFVDKNNPAYNPALVEAVNSGDADKVKTLAEESQIKPFKIFSLINFTKMQPDDIVVVFVAKPFARCYIVKIKTPAQSILQVPASMQEKFVNNHGEQINFDPISGFKYFADGTPIHAGFFHEVEVLKKMPSNYFRMELPDTIINNPINDVSQQKYIDKFLESD